jgi:hypothetical protein
MKTMTTTLVISFATLALCGLAVDDPNYMQTANEPNTTRLFRDGVTQWSREAEATKE